MERSSAEGAMRIHTIIPSRLGSTRLPGKALMEICGKPMIVRVWEQACKAGAGPVSVACGDPAIVEAVEAAGGEAVLTDPDLPRGSDRVWQALQKLMREGAEKPDIVMNVQGDEPFFPPELIVEAAKAFDLGWPDIVTFCHETDDPRIVESPACVKAVTDPAGRALYFSRAPIPYKARQVKHHIGFYAYRYEALEIFVGSAPTALEIAEDLEQLRGIELGLKYYVGLTGHRALGVDTPGDLEKARRLAGC
jgi:3-deoxy-manno-octulosonate cytidylyltransferase (CMP-KDO synthetase)